MGIVRNCIDIVGITPENELLSRLSGQHIEVSQAENLFINDNIKIKNIYQIILDTEVKGRRIINTKANKIVVIDGYKRFKIAYYDADNNMGVLELNSPYNIFFDIENNEEDLEKTDIYVADAYFELISEKILYLNIIYIVDIRCFGKVRKVEKANKTSNYSKDNKVYDDYALGKENKNRVSKDDIYREMLISEYDKRNFEEEQVESRENKLLDIDAEYL